MTRTNNLTTAPETSQASEPTSRIDATNSADRTCKLWAALPAYNEAAALPELLDNIAAECRDNGLPYEIIVVDDGSSDETAEMAREASKVWNVRLVQHPENRGLAAAIRTGLTTAVELASDDDFILTMDSDGTHPTSLIPEMLKKAQQGADVVIASRFRRGSRVMGLSLPRHLLSIAARVCFTTAFPAKGIRDYTCGYRIYRVSKLREAMDHYGDNFVSEQGFSCMVDVLLKMRKLDTRFDEVPMVLRYDLKQGDSKMRVVRTCVDTLKLIARRRMGSSN